jgi:outer membrane receptor protein involved in Fe transport
MKAIRSAGQAATAGISFDKPQWFSAAVEARYAGARFDDDLNTIKLDPFTVVGLRVNREFGNRVTAHLKVENLFDRKFDVSRTKSGLIELGAPRWVTAGLSTRW